MAKKLIITKLMQIKARQSAEAPGTYPGQNRSRKFINRKKQANKQACRQKG